MPYVYPKGAVNNLRAAQEIVVCDFCGDEFIGRRCEFRKFCSPKCSQRDRGNQAKIKRNLFREEGERRVLRAVRRDIAMLSMQSKQCCYSALKLLDKHLILKYGGKYE